MSTARPLSLLVNEPTRPRLADALDRSDYDGIGGPTVFEAAMVITARIGLAARTDLERLLAEARFEVLPFGDKHRMIALDAFEIYGKAAIQQRSSSGTAWPMRWRNSATSRSCVQATTSAKRTSNS